MDVTSSGIHQQLFYCVLDYRTISRTYRHNVLIMTQCNSHCEYEYSNELIYVTEHCFDRW